MQAARSCVFAAAPAGRLSEPGLNARRGQLRAGLAQASSPAGKASRFNYLAAAGRKLPGAQPTKRLTR